MLRLKTSFLAFLSAPVAFAAPASEAASTAAPDTALPSLVNRGTSYHQRTTESIYGDLPFGPTITWRSNAGYLAWACADFDSDGDIDVFAVKVDWTPEGQPAEYFEKHDGRFVANPAALPDDASKVLVHARKAIVTDVNGDGRPDVVVAGHGYDKPPFPGERAKLFLNLGGRFSVRDLPLPPGFYHSVCSGDIDGDGDADLFLTDCLYRPGKTCVFLLNDGEGNFTPAPRHFPPQLRGKNYFTSELYDIDRDGHLDLVVAGHDMDNAAPRILWGDASAIYTFERSTELPTVQGFRVVVDVDFIERPDSTDIVLNRTGDYKGPVGFYNGYYIQLLRPVRARTYEDFSIALLRDHFAYNGRWLPWLRIQDRNADGAPDITADDVPADYEWLSTGRVFRKLAR